MVVVAFVVLVATFVQDYLVLVVVVLVVCCYCNGGTGGCAETQCEDTGQWVTNYIISQCICNIGKCRPGTYILTLEMDNLDPLPNLGSNLL